MRRTHILLLLLLILALAAALRFSGIGWGLRHIPDADERVFVERTRDMIERGTFDPGWYEYPGLFFCVLRGALWAAPPGVREGPDAYLLARMTVAVFSTASVLLAFLLGRRLLGGSAGGLVAALWLAVSPVEIQTAHMVRPDVVLGTMVLAALVAFTRLGTRLRDDAVAGLGLGACLATKFTGAAMGPAWIAARLLAPGRRVQGLLLGGACAAAVLVLTTPRLWTDPLVLAEGLRAQGGYMYDATKDAARGLPPFAYYAQRYARSLGPMGAGLALLGLAAALRRPRPLLPGLLYAAGLLTLLGSAEARFERLIASSLGIAAVLAAHGAGLLRERWPRAASALVALAVCLPAIESFGYARALRQPLTRDAALDWIERELPRGARVVSGVPDLGVDRFAYDLASLSGDGELDALAAARADAVVLFQGDPRATQLALEAQYVATPATDWNGPAIALLRTRTPARFAPAETPAAGVRVEPTGRGGIASVALELAAPRAVACVELRFEAGGGPPPRRMSLELRAAGADAFAPVASIAGASCGAPARPGERRRALVFVPRLASGLRVRLERDNRLRLVDARLFELGRD